MTRRGLIGFALLAAVGVAVGCSDDSAGTDSSVDLGDGGAKEAGGDGPGSCKLSFAKINGKDATKVTKLTAADDKDPNSPQTFEVDVVVAAASSNAGVIVTLQVSGVAPDPSAQITDGEAAFADLPISTQLPGKKVLFRATAPGCASATLSLDLDPPPSCVFTDPVDLQTLGAADDEDLASPGFQKTVVLQTTNAEGGSLSLSVDGSAVANGKIDPIPAGGQVSFANILLPNKGFKMEAEVELGGIKTSCSIDITVSTSAPPCDITLSGPPVKLLGELGDGLGVAQDALPSTNAIDNNIRVDSVPNAQVTLLVDNVAVGTVQAGASGEANFNGQKLDDGARTITATCLAPNSGNSNQSLLVGVKVDSSVPATPAGFSCVVTDNRAGTVTCSWTSGGAQDQVEYRVRYSDTTPLTDATWAGAAATEKVAPAFPQGKTQSVVFPNLSLGTTYHFALRGVDSVRNISALANDDNVAVDFNTRNLVGIPQPNPGPTAWGAVMATGDFDCDGFTDIAVGDEAAGNKLGRVAIYPGSTNGFLSTPTKFISGTVANGEFGSALAVLPSFKGTASCNDLAVVASHGKTAAAKVFVYFGRPNFFDRDDVSVGNGAEVIFSLPGTAGANETIGARIANVGDFNGDGFSDLAISYRDTTGTNDKAMVLIVHGDSSIPLMAGGVTPRAVTLDVATPAGFGSMISGGLASTDFGMALGGGVSLDSDAHAELLIGAPKSGKGAVYVVKGAPGAGPTTIPLTDPRVIKITGATSNVSFGDYVAFVGDMDGDKSPEFAVADSGFNAAAGEVYVFNLKGATPPATPAAAVITVGNNVSGPAGDSFGVSIAAGDMASLKGADINGDGRADLVVGASGAGTNNSGAVYVFYGQTTLTNLGTAQADFVFPAPTGAVTFGQSVVVGKDFNNNTGTGSNDIAVGDPLHAASGAPVGRISYYY